MGAISKTFNRKIFLFTENLTSHKYLNILDEQLKNETNYVYQDDNDPKHRSKIVTKWKTDNNIISLEWPSNSPDLNPIENIWAILKNKIRKIKHNTITEFKENIIKFWNDIPNEHIVNTINSMPKRINEVIKNLRYYKILNVMHIFIL